MNKNFLQSQVDLSAYETITICDIFYDMIKVLEKYIEAIGYLSRLATKNKFMTTTLQGNLAT
jgi:hypothetical protein